MERRASGVGGSLRVGYQVAATLGAWSLVLAPELPRRYRLSAAIASSTPYWLAQEPLSVTLVVGPDTWEWATPTAIAVVGAVVEATVAGVPTVVRAPRVSDG